MQGVNHSEIATEAGERDRDHDATDDDVHRLPELNLADADEHLGVDRLCQGVIELPFLHFLGQAHHVRLDHRVDDAGHHNLDAEHREQLGLRPAVQLRRVRVDEPEDDKTGREREERLQYLQRKVHPILQVVHDSDPEVKQCDPDRGHVSSPPPCSGGSRGARRARRPRSRRESRRLHAEPGEELCIVRSPTSVSIGK